MGHCQLARIDDAAANQVIYAPIVRDTAVSFEYEPPDSAEIARRMRKVLADRPWLVYRNAGHLLHADARGRGIGKELNELVQQSEWPWLTSE